MMLQYEFSLVDSKAHPCSLIIIFAVIWLQSWNSLLAKVNIFMVLLAKFFVVEQAGVCLLLLHTLKDRVSSFHSLIWKYEMTTKRQLKMEYKTSKFFY